MTGTEAAIRRNRVRLVQVIGGLGVLAVLCAAVRSTRLLPGDKLAARLLARPYRDGWRPTLTRFVHIVSPSHDLAALVLVAVIVAVCRRTWRPLLYGLTVAVLVVGSLLALKAGTWRAGPQGRSHHRTGGSFPSGHLTAMLVCGETILVLLRARARVWRACLAVLSVVLAFVLLRLRDHWVSDLYGALVLSWLILVALRIPSDYDQSVVDS